MTDQPTDARARLLSHFSGVSGTSEHGEKWDALWRDNFLPWDKGSPNPALVDLLSERQDLVPPPTRERTKRALVPGCGKGYDVLLLAAHGYDAYGLEISPAAVEAAEKNERQVAGQGLYQIQENIDRRHGSVTWLAGDFFGTEFLKHLDGDKNFDLIYDYTFLSALPPSMRPAWSKRFNELLAPDGRLVCVEFPTYKPPSTGGPPWALPPRIYSAHLPRPGEVLPYGQDGELQEDNLGAPSDVGLKRIAHFQPKRTHDIGYGSDGKITDWVSVWTHPS